MKALWIFFLFVFVLAFKVHGQYLIKGNIRAETGEVISDASVVCRSSSDKIIAYTFSDGLGKYALQIKDRGVYELEFSSLGFQKQLRSIEFSVADEEVDMDVVMPKNLIRLEEVILAKDRPILIKKDTVIFSADAFIRGNEEVVEDLLKNLPYVEVDSEGTIKVGNKEIEKVMIEGDDFFDRGYKMITKNMPSEPIDKIELIENYTENRLLKDISSSNKTALNLRLKEAAKRIWFGNVELAYGLSSKTRYELSAILMNFGKKHKYYFYSNLNNIGEDSKGNISGLIHPLVLDDAITIGNGVRAYSLLQLSAVPLNFKKERTNFNNSELLSLNAIINPRKGLKITTNGFLNWDENGFFRNSTTAVNFQGVDFINSESSELLKNTLHGFGKLRIAIQPSASESIESEMTFNKNGDSSSTNLVFNSSNMTEILNTSNTFLNGSITYTNRYNKNNVLLLTTRYIYEDIPQQYTIDQFIYPELFPQNSDVDNVGQNSGSTMHFAGIEAHLLKKQDKGHLLELKLGDQYRKDDFSSYLVLKEGRDITDRPNGYQNGLEYSSNDAYFKTKYSWKAGQFGILGSLDLHWLNNTLEWTSQMQSENPFFLNPKMGIEWAPNKKNSFKANYSFTTTNVDILDIYDHYALTGFRSFSKGTPSFNQLDASNLLISYQFGNWSDKFFVNTVFLYLRNHDFFSSNTLVAQNYNLAERFLIKDRDLLNFNANMDFFIRAISSNLKLKLDYTRSDLKNVVNSSALREIVSEAYNYGLQIRSGFSGKVNFHVGTAWKKTRIATGTTNAFTDNVSFLDVSLLATNKMNFDLKTERYFFGNLDNESNTYYFVDFNARWVLQPNKLEVGLSGNNMFNTATYRTFSLNDISRYVTEFRLLPRFVLLKLKYRF
ncbi:MAG: carboxypeptidase regulatory-like domain-containing protein [Flavobacteriaceae bacterium]